MKVRAQKLKMKGMKLINCNLCGSDEYLPLLQVNRFKKPLNIVKCSKCGLIFINPRPLKDEILRYYK